MIFLPGWGWVMRSPSFMQGPIPLGQLIAPPVQYGGPPPAYSRVAPPKGADKKSSPAEPPKDKKEEQKKPPNPYAPPKLDKGCNYMYDWEDEHTLIHIFYKAAPVWEEKYRNQKLKFKIFKVSTNFTVNMVIEQALRKKGEECKEWAATETFEGGHGEWLKGTTIEYNGPKASGTLKSMGWTKLRGSGMPPVWLVVHKVDFK